MGSELEGVLVGHCQDEEALTGCSVIIFPEGAVGGVQVRGGAPASRETELLESTRLVERVNAVLVTGGSAYGLAAADGVMDFLEERGWGFDALVVKVPIVPAAAIFDLSVGDPAVRPDAAMGYAACRAASPDLSPSGSVGAGTGATVGKVLGNQYCMRGGWGFASFTAADGLAVMAWAAVNPFGDVVDEEGRIIAGARSPEGGFLDTESFLESSAGGGLEEQPNRNTTVGVLVTNARLTKAETNWLAQSGHNGFARAIRPSHTRLDGDTVFAAALGKMETPVDLVGIIGARLMAKAVRSAVLNATGAPGLPAAADLA
jgi:L-aminopeptidase/D-esterase-like protein